MINFFFPVHRLVNRTQNTPRNLDCHLSGLSSSRVLKQLPQIIRLGTQGVSDPGGNRRDIVRHFDPQFSCPLSVKYFALAV